MRLVTLLLGLCAGTASAQSLIAKTEGDPALIAALTAPGQIVDTMSAWPVDCDRVPPTDLLVQVVYASPSGGNATHRQYRIATPSPNGHILGAPFALPGHGIKSAHTHPQGALLVQFQYRAGDPRCCPSGQISTILSRGIP